MNEVNSKHVLSGFALLMLAYQGYRVVDYMSSSLTGVSETVSMLVAFAFLAFSEVGLILWLHVGKPNATTDIQETVASTLVWLCFLGSMLVGLADLAKHNTLYDVDMSVIDPILFITPWVMVFLNIAGYIIYMENDSEELMAASQRKLEHEEVKLEMDIRRDAIKELRKNREGIAKDLSPHYFEDVKSRVTGRTLKRFNRQAKRIAADREAAEIMEQDENLTVLSGNGRGNPTLHTGKGVNRKS